MFVLDASAAAPWFFRDEETHSSQELHELALRRGTISPSIFDYEIRNLLLIGRARKRLSDADLTKAFRILDLLPVDIAHVGSDPIVFRLAQLHKLTIYDASYLHVAIVKALPLATYDKALMRAAKAEHVELLTNTE